MGTRPVQRDCLIPLLPPFSPQTDETLLSIKETPESIDDIVGASVRIYTEAVDDPKKAELLTLFKCQSILLRLAQDCREALHTIHWDMLRGEVWKDVQYVLKVQREHADKERASYTAVIGTIQDQLHLSETPLVDLNCFISRDRETSWKVADSERLRELVEFNLTKEADKLSGAHMSSLATLAAVEGDSEIDKVTAALMKVNLALRERPSPEFWPIFWDRISQAVGKPARICQQQWLHNYHPLAVKRRQRAITKPETVLLKERVEACREAGQPVDWPALAAHFDRDVFELFAFYQQKLNMSHQTAPWTAEEEASLIAYYEQFSETGRGGVIASKANNADKIWLKMSRHFPNKSPGQLKQKFDQLKGKSAGKREKAVWTFEDDLRLQVLVRIHGRGNWVNVATHMPGRTDVQIRERYENVLAPELTKKHTWSDEETAKLLQIVQTEAIPSWTFVAEQLGTGRSDAECAKRWQRICPSSELARRVRLQVNKRLFLPRKVPGLKRGVPVRIESSVTSNSRPASREVSASEQQSSLSLKSDATLTHTDKALMKLFDLDKDDPLQELSVNLEAYSKDWEKRWTESIMIPPIKSDAVIVPQLDLSADDFDGTEATRVLGKLSERWKDSPKPTRAILYRQSRRFRTELSKHLSSQSATVTKDGSVFHYLIGDLGAMAETERGTPRNQSDTSRPGRVSSVGVFKEVAHRVRLLTDLNDRTIEQLRNYLIPEDQFPSCYRFALLRFYLERLARLDVPQTDVHSPDAAQSLKKLVANLLTKHAASLFIPPDVSQILPLTTFEKLQLCRIVSEKFPVYDFTVSRVEEAESRSNDEVKEITAPPALPPGEYIAAAAVAAAEAAALASEADAATLPCESALALPSQTLSDVLPAGGGSRKPTYDVLVPSNDASAIRADEIASYDQDVLRELCLSFETF